MNYGRWETRSEKGRGGQGVTYLAEDSNLFFKILDSIARAVPAINGIGRTEDKHAWARTLADGMHKYISAIQNEGIVALKVLHDDIRTDSKALARLKQEIEVLTKHSHENIVKIIDSNASEGWFATTFFPLGTLADNSKRFQSKSFAALQAFRPLVEAVATLHRVKIVHRDIKPANIFFSEGGLVLGDFGLVFFADENKSRISDTYENVGSRDWMPAWAYGKRVEDIAPSFDVFSLGKVLWAMISGKTILPLWYHRKPEFDLSRQFSRDPHVHMINALLDGCIQENEENVGYPDAIELLKQIDSLLEIMYRDGELLRLGITRTCRVCGYGEYELIADDTQTPTSSENAGFHLRGQLRLRIFCCRRCGNVQMFQMQRNPEAWGSPQ